MCDNTEVKEFKCNSYIIKSLLHYLAYSERKKAQEWLTKLTDAEEAVVDPKLRNEYTFYLLINVQNGTMSQPFNKPPPQGKLKPLCRVLPDYLYEDVMRQLKISHCRLDKLINSQPDNYSVPVLDCEPKNFGNEHACPKLGVMAHCAVFSNYSRDGKK